MTLDPVRSPRPQTGDGKGPNPSPEGDGIGRRGKGEGKQRGGRRVGNLERQVESRKEVPGKKKARETVDIRLGLGRY